MKTFKVFKSKKDINALTINRGDLHKNTFYCDVLVLGCKSVLQPNKLRIKLHVNMLSS